MAENKHLLHPVRWNRIEKIQRIVSYMLFVKEIQHMFAGKKADEKIQGLEEKIKQLKEEANKL